MNTNEIETRLTELCRKLESTAEAGGGLPHAAEQQDWGCDWEVSDNGEDYRIYDCDGETIAAGPAEKILSRESVLIAKIGTACDQARFEEQADDE